MSLPVPPPVDPSDSNESKPPKKNWSKAPKKEIQKSVNLGLLSIYKKKKKPSKSTLWDVYYNVGPTHSNIIDGWVAHKQCKSIFVYKSKNGTSHLQRHLKTCSEKTNKKGNQLTIEQIMGTKKIPKEIREEIINACVGMCVRDYRPFSTIDGVGFGELVEVLFRIGAKYGALKWKVKPHGVKPHRTTISNRAEAKEKSVREGVSQILAYVYSQPIPPISYTTDLMSDKLKRRAYMSVGGHYIDEMDKMAKLTIDCCFFDGLFEAAETKEDSPSDSESDSEELQSSSNSISSSEQKEEEKIDGSKERVPHTAENINLGLDVVFRKYSDINKEITFERTDPILETGWTTDSGLFRYTQMSESFLIFRQKNIFLNFDFHFV